MRSLVTGAHGFVGRHLTEHLAAAGDDVQGVDRSGPGGADLTDAEAVHDLVARAQPEAVYHLAGYSDVGRSWSEPVAVLRANAEGTLNLLSACRDAGVARVLLVSSAEVYGQVKEDELPLDEEAPLRPASPYAASKVAAEYLGVQAQLGHGLATLRVRAFNHLGPGQSRGFVASAIAAQIAECERDGRDEIRVGNLSTRRDFTDVRDVVRAYRLLVAHGQPGEVYNVCSGVDRLVSDLAEALVSRARRPVRLVADPALHRPVDLPVLRGDNRRLRAITGWEPEVPLKQTLDDLLEHWRAETRRSA